MYKKTIENFNFCDICFAFTGNRTDLSIEFLLTPDRVANHYATEHP